MGGAFLMVNDIVQLLLMTMGVLVVMLGLIVAGMKLLRGDVTGAAVSGVSMGLVGVLVCASPLLMNAVFDGLAEDVDDVSIYTTTGEVYESDDSLPYGDYVARDDGAAERIEYVDDDVQSSNVASNRAFDMIFVVILASGAVLLMLSAVSPLTPRKRQSLRLHWYELKLRFCGVSRDDRVFQRIDTWRRAVEMEP